MVKLAAYIGKGEVGNHLIRAWTRRPESHCELVVNGIAYSSSIMDKGVRKKYIDFDPDNWYFVDVPWATPTQIIQHYEKTKHRHYNFKGLILSQVFNRDIDDSEADFCSEWCAEALGMPNARIYNPGTLVDTVKWINTKITQ